MIAIFQKEKHICLPGNKTGSIYTKYKLPFSLSNDSSWNLICFLLMFPAKTVWWFTLLQSECTVLLHRVCIPGWPTYASCSFEFYRYVLFYDIPRHLCGALMTCFALAPSIFYSKNHILKCLAATYPLSRDLTEGNINSSSMLRNWKHAGVTLLLTLG